MLEIEVCEVRGHCPVYKVGDKITIDDPKIILDKTDALCTHALSSLLHYTLALERGADPVKLGLSKLKDREHAYIQCVDPGEPLHPRWDSYFQNRKSQKSREESKMTARNKRQT
jgi:uncharacterized repeat protein (TIGR04076 family)